MIKYKFVVLILTIILTGFLYFSLQNKTTNTQGEEFLHGVIKNITSVDSNMQKLDIEIIKGSLKGRKITVDEDQSLYLNRRNFQKGDKVLIQYTQENNEFVITDFVRSGVLLWLFLLFTFFVVLIAKWQGVGAILGMLITFLVLFKISLPWILAGGDPITVAIVSSLLIIPSTFYSSHGVSRKTTVSVISTIITLIIAGVLALIFSDLANLTGLASEAASFIKLSTAEKINFRGLLLAGMLIGVLGVLDDITISQAAIVEELRLSKSNISKSELYQRAMNVGRAHIASIVNTIILIYTGSALPLLLLLFDYSEPFSQVINFEPFAEEIIRTLIGSLGLILAVPITTFIAIHTLKGDAAPSPHRHVHM
ncbi:YibE/F family protein [Candidatus Peregrinibacteria bacterium]|nr:YibE/F family protein [Candidatus Peregrinibacteria bacterium]